MTRRGNFGSYSRGRRFVRVLQVSRGSIRQPMRRSVRAGRVGSRFDTRLLSSAAAILLLTSPSQATITTMAAGFTAGDGAAVLEASLQPSGNASNVHSSEELIDFTPQININ